LDMEKTMSSLNKIRILENDEQKKTNPNSNEAFELGFVDSLLNFALFLGTYWTAPIRYFLF
ncbi:hypothetical protein OEV82_14415, partial [Caldibacillus thermolactis]